MAVTRPGNVGKRLMPHVIDHLGQYYPDKVAGSMPRNNSTLTDGFRQLTFGELAHAVNYTAWWIEKNYGRSDNYDTLTFIGANDIRYLTVIMACNKTGYRVSPGDGKRMKEGNAYGMIATALIDSQLGRSTHEPFRCYQLLTPGVYCRTKSKGIGAPEPPSQFGCEGAPHLC